MPSASRSPTTQRPKTVIQVYFANVTDPRVTRTRLHSLVDILTIALCAVIGGADGWDEMHDYGVLKEPWLKTFLPLAHGIPSADTFRRVLSSLRPSELRAALSAWMADVQEKSVGRLIALDGKTLRRSFDTASGWGPVQVVNAWAKSNGLCLGQLSTASDGDEIGGVRRLLEFVDVEGAVVTADALHAQKATAAAIVAKGADYVLGVKANQKTLHGSLKRFFADAGELRGLARPYEVHTTEESGHGRTERRTVWCASARHVANLGESWPCTKTIAMVTCERANGQTTRLERRYFISSLEKVDAKTLGEHVRGHWSIENQLHYVLDTAFAEDDSRIRTDHGPENFALLRRIALSLLKQEKKTSKMGIAAKRKATGWSDDYLLVVLSAGLSEI